jgi:hypothetical protein
VLVVDARLDDVVVELLVVVGRILQSSSSTSSSVGQFVPQHARNAMSTLSPSLVQRARIASHAMSRAVFLQMFAAHRSPLHALLHRS